MSITAVQLVARGVRQASASTIVLTPTAGTRAGNMLFVASNSNAVLSSVTDSKGNTYYLGPLPGTTHSNAYSAWTYQDSGTLTTSDSITVTWATATFNHAATVYEFSGVSHQTAADTTGINNATLNTATVTTSGAILDPNSLLIGVVAWDDATLSDSFTADAAYTLGDSIAEVSGSFYGVALQYRVLSSASLTTQSAAGTISGGGVGHSSRVLLAFSPASTTTTVSLLTATAVADATPMTPHISSTGIASVGILTTGILTTGSATQVLTPQSDAQTGSLLILAANALAGHTLLSVTDTKSNTWIVGPNPGSTSAQSLTAWTSQNAGTLTTADAITVTYDSTGFNKVALIYEFEGQNQVAPLDVSGTAVASSTTPSVATSSAIHDSDDLLVGIFAWAKTSGPQRSFTAGAGYTLGGQVLENDVNSFAGIALEYQILSGASLAIESASGTLDGAPSSGAATILAFSPVPNNVVIALPTGTASAAAVVLGVSTGGWVDIGGATTSTYVPVTGDIGNRLRTRVIGTNTAGSAIEFTPATNPVIAGSVAPTSGAPTVDTPTPIFNQVIHALANDPTWNGTKPLTYTYLWQASVNGTSWSNATGAGATTSSYTVASADVGQILRVTVTGTNAGGSLAVASPPTRIVTLTAVAPTRGFPQISDTSPTVGELVAAIANEGTWDGTLPLSFAYQWQHSPDGIGSWSNASGVGDATASYVVDSTDLGLYLRVQVTATNTAGSFTAFTPASSIVTASPFDLALVTAPLVTFNFDPPRVGDLLTSTTGTWTGSAPITFAYDWQHSIDGTNWIDASGLGKSTSSYIVDQTDLGLELRCLVSAMNPTGTSAAGSNATNSVILGNTAFTSELIVLKTSTGPITAESSILINLTSIGPPGSAADSILVTLDTTPPIVIGGKGSAAGRPNYLRFCGVEIANQARVISYVQNGLAGPLFDVGTGGFCPQLLADAGRTAFIDPQADAAPWFDVNRPESRDFLGFLCTDLEILASVESVSATNILGNPGGAVFGPRRRSGRFIYATGSLISASPEGLDYGFQWLKSTLQSSYCDDCATCFADVRITCPPLDGSDNQRGFWRLLEVALVDGPKISQTYDYDCAYLVDIEFTLEAAKPYLYKLPQVCVQPQELLQDDGSTNCIAFDQWLCGAPTAAPICCQINPPLVGTIATQVVIETQLGVGGVLIASYASPTPVATDVPVSQMVIPYLPPGSTLVLDSGTHEAVFIAANGSQTDGQPYISLPVGQTLGWVEVAHCDPAHSICISPLHPCSGGIGTFVSVSTIYRES